MVGGDEALVEGAKTDWRALEWEPRDRAMLEFVDLLTRHPSEMTRQHVEGLREVGFDDRAILQITMLASFFNYVNRVADALGVGRE